MDICLFQTTSYRGHIRNAHRKSIGQGEKRMAFPMFMVGDSSCHENG